MHCYGTIEAVLCLSSHFILYSFLVHIFFLIILWKSQDSGLFLFNVFFVSSRWSDEDSPEGEHSLKGPSVELTTSNEYRGRKSLETKFEGVVDYDFKNKFEAIEEEAEEEIEDEAWRQLEDESGRQVEDEGGRQVKDQAGRQLEDEVEDKGDGESQELGDEISDELDKDIENSLTMDLEEDLREEDNNMDANNTRFQVPTPGLPRPGRKRQIFPINKVKGVGLALILGRRGMSHRLQRTSHVRSPIKH